MSTASTATPYLEIVGQMVLAGLGMGLTTAPATEAIMGVVPKEKAGVGSAVNDATRELGATLGVAIIGSVYASLYASGIQDAAGTLPAPALDAASDSIGAALTVAGQLGPAGQPLLEASHAAFFDGFQLGCLVAASVLIAGAAFAARFLPPAPPSPPHPNPSRTGTCPRNRQHRRRRRPTRMLLGPGTLPHNGAATETLTICPPCPRPPALNQRPIRKDETINGMARQTPATLSRIAARPGTGHGGDRSRCQRRRCGSAQGSSVEGVRGRQVSAWPNWAARAGPGEIRTTTDAGGQAPA